MKVIAFVTQKGGSGKSTLAQGIAVAAGQDREKVFVLEFDRQGTMRRWADRREADSPGFDTIHSEQELTNALATLEAQRYSLVVLDTPGYDSPMATAAIRAADFCLVPSRPAPADLEATAPTLEAIQGANRKFAFILNQTPIRSARLNEAIGGLKMLGVLAEPNIVLRNDHQDALGAGLGVTELNPEGKAAEEIRQLWRWTKKKLKG